MTNITITKTITQPEEVINQFADDLGYPEMIADPSYTGDDMAPIIPNTQTRTEYVSDAFDVVAAEWFAQFARRNAEREAQAQITNQVAATKEAIKATITTQM